MLHKTTAASRQSTYFAFLDALPYAGQWMDFRITADDQAPDANWSAEITVTGDGSSDPLYGKTATLNHTAILQAMDKIANDSESVQLAPRYCEEIATVLSAAAGEDTDDALCQLDVNHFDAIVQVAALGDIHYG